MLQRYSSFERFGANELSDAHSLVSYSTNDEYEVINNLKKMLHLRLKTFTENGQELFGSRQNTKWELNAESYYQTLFKFDSNAWNIRDTHMMETLDHLLHRSGEGAKAIVWAHNSHIGDYQATDMKNLGYINLGGLARLKYGQDNVALVGLGSYQGKVLASSVWDGPKKIMNLPPAVENSYEFCLHQAAVEKDVNQFYLLLRGRNESAFAKGLGHRGVGAIYDSTREQYTSYLRIDLEKCYDAFIFIDHTQALKTLNPRLTTEEFHPTFSNG